MQARSIEKLKIALKKQKSTFHNKSEEKTNKVYQFRADKKRKGGQCRQCQRLYRTRTSFMSHCCMSPSVRADEARLSCDRGRSDRDRAWFHQLALTLAQAILLLTEKNGHWKNDSNSHSTSHLLSAWLEDEQRSAASARDSSSSPEIDNNIVEINGEKFRRMTSPTQREKDGERSWENFESPPVLTPQHPSRPDLQRAADISPTFIRFPSDRQDIEDPDVGDDRYGGAGLENEEAGITDEGSGNLVHPASGRKDGLPGTLHSGHTRDLGFLRSRVGKFIREMPTLPYALSFWGALVGSLYDKKLLDHYEPLSFASSYLKRSAYISQSNFHLFCIHPLRNQTLFAELSKTFSISLLLLACDSRGERRCLLSVVGTSSKCLANQIALVYVTDSEAFHEGIGRGGAITEDLQTQVELRSKRVLSQESKAVVAQVEEALAREEENNQDEDALNQVRVGRAPPSKLSPNNDYNPTNPALANFPIPFKLERWIQCDDAGKFLSTFVCRKECGSIFERKTNRNRHESGCVRNPETENGDDSRFIKIRYSKKEIKPKPRLLDNLFTVGYRVDPGDITPSGLVACDIESLQTLLPPPTSSDSEKSTRSWTIHSIYCFGFSAALEGNRGCIYSDVLYAARFSDGFEFITNIVEKLKELALEHQKLQFTRCSHLRQSLARDLDCVESENKNGYNAMTLRKCVRSLDTRLSTLVLGFYNGSSFDLPTLLHHGYLAALKKHFPDIRILKRGSRYLSIVARDPISGLSLRHIDFMLLSIRCSLASYLSSHSKLLASMGQDGALSEADRKGSLPYHHIGKALDGEGRDSGYAWTLQDFDSPISGEGNSLGREHARYLMALKDWEGDEARALKSIGASSPPKSAAETFTLLQQSWHKRGLMTAFQVLHDYQMRDTEPLLKISLHKQEVCLKESGTGIFLDYATVSSFAWSCLLRSALEGSDRLHLHPLEPWLTKELRENLVGGPSFCVIRLMEKGQAIAPLRLTGAPDELEGQPPQELASHSLTLDCNGLYAHSMRWILHGIPIYRFASNGFEGRVFDSINSSFAAEWLGFVENSQSYGVTSIQTLYTGREAYVNISRHKHGDAIDRIYKATIGKYLDEEGVKEKMTIPVNNQLLLRPPQADSSEESRSSTDIEEGTEEDKESLRDFLVDDDLDEEELQTILRKETEDSERKEGEAGGCEGDFLPHPYAGGVASLAAVRMRQKQEGETLLPIRLPKSGQRSQRVETKGLRQRRLSSSSSDSQVIVPPPPISHKAKKRARDGETLKQRFSNKRKLLRFRVDGISRKPDNLRIIFEACVCGAGHRTCGCSDCPFTLDPSLLERRRFPDGRSLGRVAADDSFRTQILELEYEVIIMYRCQWEKASAVEGSHESEFSLRFNLSSSDFPIRHSFTESQIISHMADGDIDGLLKCSIFIPHRHRLRLSPLAPIFRNVAIDWTSSREPMRSYLRYQGAYAKPTKMLVSLFEADNYVLTSRYARYLIKAFDAVISNVDYFIEMEVSTKLTQFTSQMTEKRRKADEEGNEVMASYAKIQLNSAYGTSLYRPEKNLATRLVTSKEEWGRALRSGNLVDAAFVGPPDDRQSLIEVSKSPRAVTVNSPIIIGVCILNDAKICLLSAFDFLSRMLRPTAWCLNGGLWKVECDQAVQMAFVSPKLYCMRSEDGSSKLASRGVSRASNYLSFDAYKDAVLRPLRFSQKLEKAGVKVVGPGKLAWVNEKVSLSQPLPLFTYAPSFSSDPSPSLSDLKLMRMNSELLRWMEGEVGEEGEEKPPLLFVSNFSIQPLPGSRHTMTSVTTRKKIFSGNFLKRQCLEDCLSTIPIPESTIRSTNFD